MSELDTLLALNAQTHLIRSIADKDLQLANVAEFTRRAAWALRDQGYGNVRKTVGVNVQGRSADVIMRKTDGAAFDIVVGKQTDNPSVAFNSSPALDVAQFFVEPQPEPGESAPPPPPPPPDPPAPGLSLADLVTAANATAVAGGHVAEVLMQIATTLSSIDQTLKNLSVRVKF